MRPITMLFLVTAFLVSASTRAAAQTPSAEVSIEYAYLHDPDLKNMPKGWAASAALHLTDAFSLVGDVGANYKTEDLIDFDVAETAKETITSFHGGVRLTARGDSGRAWIQALAGGTRASIHFQSDDSSDSETHFSIQPGVGFDFRLTDSLALRAGGDYRRVFFEGSGVNEYRAHGGIVFYFGAH